MHIEVPRFRSHALVRGGHAQTVAGFFWPGTRAYRYTAIQHRLTLPDGDQIVLHEDHGQWKPGGPVALMLHGLGGSHLSPYMVRGAAKLIDRGVRVFRMDLRGWGAGFGLNRLPLHAGRSEDARLALEHVMQWCPDSPVSLIGFSMGANIVLKAAGELGPQAPQNLASVMAVSPPICLVTCTSRMQSGLNRFYDQNFIRWLQRYHERRRQVFPDESKMASFPSRLLEYDEQVTAPQCGFQSAAEYYEQSSAGPVLNQIGIPALIVTAADDPIIPVATFEQANYSPSTQLEITSGGGHLGFIGAGGVDADRRWIDWRMVDWVLRHGKRAEAWHRPAFTAGTHRLAAKA